MRQNSRYLYQKNLQPIQDLNIFSFQNGFFLAIPLKVSRKDSSNFISLALLIINLEIISRKFVSQIYLFRVQIFCIYEMVQVVIVHKNENSIFIIFQIMALGLKNFNSCQKFVIMGLILSFYRNHLSKNKNHQRAPAQLI